MKVTRTTELAVKVTVTTALLLALVGQSGWALRRSKCSAERDAKMDNCAAKMGFLGDHSFVVPKNLTSMGGFCSELNESIACIQSYSRDCLQGLTKQLLTSLLKRGKQQYNLICQSDNSRKDFIAKLSCLSDQKIPKFHGCMDASIARFEYIATKVRPDARLPSLCCSYQIFNRDVDSTMDQICGRPAELKGSPKEFVLKVVGGTAGEVFGLICENLRTLADCKNSDKTKSVLAKLEETTNKVNEGKLRPKNRSLIPVLLEILDSTSA